MDDLVEHARELVAKRYPDALAAFLGGSASTGTATPTSDLDIAVLMPTGHNTQRETTRERGRLVEWFVHTPETVDRFLDNDERRGVMASIYGKGIVLADRDGAAQQIALKARVVFDAGPPQLTAEQLEARRYGLTDALDDLVDTVDPHEQLAVAEAAFTAAAILLCDLRGSWHGHGKWLPRRLLAADESFGQRLLDARLQLARTGDATALLAAIRHLLDEAGGPVREGFRRTAT